MRVVEFDLVVARQLVREVRRHARSEALPPSAVGVGAQLEVGVVGVDKHEACVNGSGASMVQVRGPS